MSRRNLRQVPRINYYEPEEPSWDEYIYCDECWDYVYEYCCIHGDLLVIPDDKVPTKVNFPSYVPRAALTIPHVFLHLAPSIISGAGLGVYATLTLPRGVRFGPYRGQRTQDINSMYGWQIYDRNNKPSHVVDAADADRSNWMRYVNCARHWREQNLIAYQYQGELYYRTIKIIPRFTELMVFYGGEFAYRLGVDLAKYNSPLPRPLKSGVPVAQKPATEINNSMNYIKHENIIEKGKSDAVKPKFKNKKKTVSNDNINIGRGNDCDQNNNSEIVSINNVTDDLIKDKYNYAENNNINSKEQQNIIKKSNINKNVILNDSQLKLCSVVKEGFTKDTNLITHLDAGDKLYSCNECKKSFNRKNTLKKHICIHSGEKPYKCDICEQRFTSKGSLKIHIRIHTGEKPYKCNICEKKFNIRSSLNIHTRIHTGEKPYKCNICEKSFNECGSLRKHIRIHTGEKPYKCDICEKSFNECGSLRNHIRIHTGEKPYKCDICEKSFNIRSNLKIHIRIHSGEKPYKCDICEKSFNQRGSLKIHIRIHSGEKPYKCDICEKSFNQRGHLKIHIRIHTGEKPYKCNICEKGFNQISDLKKHIRIHTGEKPSSSSASPFPIIWGRRSMSFSSIPLAFPSY